MLNFFSALAFLTIIPVPAQAPLDDGKKVLYFPLVGLLIGCLLVAVDYLGSLVFYQEIRVVVDILFLAVISGGLHLDGLADSADGLLSNRPRERALEIMRDPHMGVMGGLAIIFCLSLKSAGLMGLGGKMFWLWLLAAPAFARTALVVGLVFMDYVRKNEGLGKDFFQRNNYGLLKLSFLPFPLPFLLGWEVGIKVIVLTVGISIALLWFFKFKLGGMTGDTLGALSEGVETTVLLTGGLVSMNQI